MTESALPEVTPAASHDAILRPCLERIKAQLSARKHAKLQEDLESLLEKLSIFFSDSLPAHHGQLEEAEHGNIEDRAENGPIEETHETDESTGALASVDTASNGQKSDERDKTRDTGHMSSNQQVQPRKTGALADGASRGKILRIKYIFISG